MERGRGPGAMFLLRNIIIVLISFCFAISCARIKTEQKHEQKPAPSLEEKVEQFKKEDPSPSQPSPEPSAKPASPTATPSISEPSKPIPPSQPLISPTPSLRTTTVVWEAVNLREGPGLNYKVIGSVKKGTPLSVLEDKGSWLRVRLEDGKEAWVSKAATSDAPKPPPATAPKPKPM